ncbi:M23 family metallopeptidase [Streptomyces sp. B93]|uniref:M23 family metallopeptidase n=1 Tax=Streptomyces sp. B93 TaxID=2824875 RepID=UPI001B37A557|nr:M23 family metallopeptidase [Streptomyces sp. B93]
MPVSCARETCRRLSCPRTAGYSRRTALAAPVVEAKEKLVNDRHPSGIMTSPASASEAASAHYAPYGGQDAQYGDFTTYSDHNATGFDAGYGATGHVTATFSADPLFGTLPDHTQATGAYDATQWATGSHQTLNYDPYAAQHHAAYDTGAYETTAWTSDYEQLGAIPHQTTGPESSGQWDASTWLQPEQPGTPAADQTQQWDWNQQQAYDTGAYDATQWNSDGTAPETTRSTEAYDGHETYEGHEDHESGYQHDYVQQAADHEGFPDTGAPAAHQEHPADDDSELSRTGELPAVEPLVDHESEPLLDDQEEHVPAPASRAAARAGRSRRRTPAKRSALLTVAVPSACVMGVAGIAAASVGTFAEDEPEAPATAAETPVKKTVANDKLAAQLEGVTADANDFGDRVSRTQERIDLKAEQEAEQKRAAAEAARKERLRPKFALPVANHGLSAYFGQSGINWMSVHTGIDFPVAYGTTVMAATDGTVRTEYNSAYGNMMIVTAMDGTETWYCHLSSYQVLSGTTVKAGDAIAYSGNSGNSTGPHLHFEVRPGGGSAIDPLAWLRSHGLNPS